MSSGVDANLLNHGVASFHHPDTTFPDLNQLPSYEPYTFPVGGPFGPIYGWSELFLGFTNSASTPQQYPNIELLTSLNLGNSFRAQFLGNLRKLPYNNAANRAANLSELYLEYLSEGEFGASSHGADRYHLSVRLGKSPRTDYPYIDPLSLADRLPSTTASYTGALVTAEVESACGIGAHGSLFQRIGGGGVGSNFIPDAYALYRHRLDSGLFYEGRIGWLPRSQGFVPSQGASGAEGYLGYQSPTYGGGIFVGESFHGGATIGGSITLARNSLTELLGIAPSRLVTRPDAGFRVEAPVARAFLFTALKPREGEPLVGVKDDIYTWDSGNGAGLGTVDAIAAGTAGSQGGANVRRVVSATPWWLYQNTVEHIPGDAGQRSSDGIEDYTHFRSDLQYRYYRVEPMNIFRVAIKAVAPDSTTPVAGASIQISGPAGSGSRTVVTDANGTALVDLPVPTGSTGAFHISGTATHYPRADKDITLNPSILNEITVQFGALTGSLSGTVKDSLTGAAVPDAEVILIPAGTAAESVVHTTDSSGAYAFNNLQPGPYTVEIHRPGYDDITQSVVVPAGPPTIAGFTIVAQRGAVVGHIVDADGNAIAGATVTILDSAGAQIGTLVSGAEGNFVQRAKAGTYTIRVEAPGYASASATVNIPPGQLQNLTITVQKQP